jgi:hypothetical protein
LAGELPGPFWKNHMIFNVTGLSAKDFSAGLNFTGTSAFVASRITPIAGHRSTHRL